MKLEGVRTMSRSMGLEEAGAQKLKRNDWSLKGYLSAFRAMLIWVLLMPGSGGRSMEAGQRRQVWRLSHALEKDCPQILFTKCCGVFNFHQILGRREFRIMCFLGRDVPELCSVVLAAPHMRPGASTQPASQQSVLLTCILSHSRQIPCTKRVDSVWCVCL